MSSECENLIRRMLVLEPTKRFSIEQIKNHRWMQMGEGGPRSAPPSPLIGYNAKVGEFNEQILRLMQSLGINQQKTMEALQNDAYDHYTAIYYLLLERLRSHRSSFPVENRIDSRKRRPSTIAEQAILRVTPNQGTQVVGIKQFGQSTESAMSHANQLLGELDMVPTPGVSACLQDIIPQPCVKTMQNMAGHMITTSIDEGVEADIMDSRDDEIISHKGQTYVKDGFGLGLIPSSAFGDFSQLSNTSLCSVGTSTNGSPCTSFDSSLEADLVSSLSAFSQQLGNSCYPPVCSNPSVTVADGITSQAQVMGSNPQTQCQNVEENVQDRSQNRSPVDFREGRRASDGHVAQGIIAFRQRLKESMRAPGMSELRQDHQHLQNIYGMNMAPNNMLPTQLVGEQPTQKLRPRPLMKRMSLPSETFDMQPHKILAIKQSIQVEQQMDRVSSHDNVPPQPLYEEQSNKPLQQQLLQHRLQQKRHSFHQKHGPGNGHLHQQMQQLQIEAPHTLFPPNSSHQTGEGLLHHNTMSVSRNGSLVHAVDASHVPIVGRPPVIRKVSYKLAQQQTVMPCDPSELLPWQKAILENEGMENNTGISLEPNDMYNNGQVTFGLAPSQEPEYQPTDLADLVDYSQFAPIQSDCGMETNSYCNSLQSIVDDAQNFSAANYTELPNQCQQQVVYDKTNIAQDNQFSQESYMQNYYQMPSQQTTFNMVNLVEDSSMDMS